LKGRGKKKKISQVHGMHIKVGNVYRNSFNKNPEERGPFRDIIF
jgi:hypothetical protein